MGKIDYFIGKYLRYARKYKKGIGFNLSEQEFPFRRRELKAIEYLLSLHVHPSVHWQTDVKGIGLHNDSRVPFCTTWMAWHEGQSTFAWRVIQAH